MVSLVAAMESTPKSTQARYVAHGCQKHTKLRLRPLQFVQDFTSSHHSLHSNASLTALLEESSLCSSLGEVDTSWFDSERWTSHEESKWIKEDFLKTPQASQRETKGCSTPGLFTPDGLSPVARRQKDYPDGHAPPDEDSISSFARPKRFRKVPSSMHTTPNSQIITSHQPTSAPTAVPIEEEEEDDEEVAEPQDPPTEIQFSPFPTWNPTHQKDTPIFIKQLFKTPSTLCGTGDKRACSTPLQRLSTPQRLSRSLGAEPEESDLSWTSSLATPPMSTKGRKTVTSSDKKDIQDDTWQTHDVAKVLFKDGCSVVEMDSCEEGDEGSTQPLQVIKLPSITDESQEEEFTMETEDVGESDKSGAEGSKAPGHKQPSHSDVSNGAEATFNHRADQAADGVMTKSSQKPPSTSLHSPLIDHGKPHLANQERHDSINEHAPVKKAHNQYSEEKIAIQVKDVAVQDAIELGMNSPAELKSGIAIDECMENNVSSKLASETHDSFRSHSSLQSAMSLQGNSFNGSSHASQTLFNSQESTKNEKTTMEETLAFLLATPPSRREKLLKSLGASGGSMVENVTTEQAGFDSVSSNLEIKCDSPATSSSFPTNSISYDTLMSPPPGLFRKPSTSTYPSDEPLRNPRDSECSMDAKTMGRQAETPNRPAPDIDLLSPISPNFAEALCRVTDIASKVQPSGSNSTLTVQKSLGVERNLIGDFISPDSETARSKEKAMDQLRSGDHSDTVLKKDSSSGTFGQNAIAQHLSTPITSSLSTSAYKQLPKPLLPKEETRPAVPVAKSSAISNLSTQNTTKGRFKYSAGMPRKDAGSESKTPSWLSRAVYVEEDEEKTKDTVEAESKDVSSQKPWTMKRPCRTAQSFTTFSTFCKTAPNLPTRPVSSSQNQISQRTSTTPTSSRSIVQSAPPHNKTLIRIREIPHSWPSPKRLRLEEERDEFPINIGLKGLSSSVNEHEKETEDLRAPLKRDVESHHVHNDLSSPNPDKLGNDDIGLEDFQDKVISRNHLSSSGDHHQPHLQNQSNTNQVASGGGFSSASGKAIFVSSEALKKAEKLLEDVDKEKPAEEFQLNLSTEDNQCGFQSASGKSIAISEAALSKAKKMIAEVTSGDEETLVSNLKQPTSFGFMSAKGRVIKVSEAAMAKARKMMNDINQEEESDTAELEGKVEQISGKHSVDGGGDASRIQNVETGLKMSLPGNALPKGKADSRHRNKGFRPFKPPSLVAKVQKPSNLPSPISISPVNQNSGINVVRETERGGPEVCRVSVPDESSTILEQHQDKQELADSLNGQPGEDGELDITEDDDCLSASQAAREIKAAEEMELVYNFMQEEDTGFSQLDMSSILASDQSENGAAQLLTCADKKEAPVQEKEDHLEIGIKPVPPQDFPTENNGHFIEPEPQHQTDATNGAIGESSNRNEESPVSDLVKESHLEVALVQGQVSVRSCESEDEENPPPKCTIKETPHRHLKAAGEDHVHRLHALDKEVPMADLSMNTVKQLMEDSSMMIEDPDEDRSDITNPVRESAAVTDAGCTDESTAHGKIETQGQFNPSSSTKTVCIRADHLHGNRANMMLNLGSDSSPEQNKPGSRMDNNFETHSSVGFKTAGGKQIQVSESALKKASSLLSDCNSDEARIGEYMTDATYPEENTVLIKSDDRSNAKDSIGISSDNMQQHGEMIIANDINHSAMKNSTFSSDEHLPSCVSSALPDLCQVGFQTAGGKDIKISESSLQKARLVIGESDEVHFDEKPNDYSLDSTSAACFLGSGNEFISVGFQTAGGNKVQVSRAALQRAREIIEAESEHTIDSPARGPPTSPPNTPSFETSSASCDMNQHHTTLESQQLSKKSSSVTSGAAFPHAVGFQTASGNYVTVSEDSLSRARQLFAESSESTDYEGSLETTNIPNAVGFRTAREGKISVLDVPLQAARKPLSSEIKSSDEEAIGKAADEQGFYVVGFQTASGNSVEISRASLLKATQLLDCDPESHDTKDIHTDHPHNLASDDSNGNSEVPVAITRHVKPEVVLDTSGQGDSVKTKHSPPRQIGFQTARGDAISISDESLRKAKQLLGDDDPDHCNIQEKEVKKTVTKLAPPRTGFQTGSGKLIHVSESAIQEAKQLLSTDVSSQEDILSPDVESSTAPNNRHPAPVELEVSFQTGSGRRIGISESSLQKVRQLFSGDERDANQNVMKSQCSFQRKKSNSDGGGKNIEISEELLQHACSLLGSDNEEMDKVAQSPLNQDLQNESVTVGFQTGHGKKVQISETSLQKAKQFLSDESDIMPNQNVAVGFQTGHGKKVQISEASIQRARQILGGNEKITDQNAGVGFQTAQGKKVQISEASIQRARQFLAYESDIMPNQNVAVGFQTGHGKAVQISEASMKKAKQFLADGNEKITDQNPVVGFQTAQGKKVQISEASIQRARQFLSDESDIMPNQNVTVGFQTGHGKAVEISEASMTKARQFLADGNEKITDQNAGVGFHTAQGKKVQISEESIQRARKFLADERDIMPNQNVAVGFQTRHGKAVQISEASMRKARQFLADETDALPDQAIAVGFQTGHGKKVQISEASIQTARQFLVDETDALPDQTIAVGFQTGHGKKVKISEASIQRARQFLADETDALPDQTTTVGFQTGHGKKVQISEAAMLKAKQFLADENDAGTGASSSNSAVSCVANERILTGKPSEIAGFNTGDGRKIPVSEASLQQTSKTRGSQCINGHVSRESSGEKQLHDSQQQRIVSRTVDDYPSCPGKDSKEENFQQERSVMSTGGHDALPLPSNLPQKRPATRGLARRGSMDSRNRPSSLQRSLSRGSLGTGQKPYKPPRRVTDKGSPSDRGLNPRRSNPTVVLNDRTNQLKALQSSPPARQSTSSLHVSDAGPFVKPCPNEDATDQSQSQPEATPTLAEGACSFEVRWAEARRAQQQRIDAKRKKVIKPELGSLWRSRKQDDRISLRDFVDHQHPSSMSDSELFCHGILSSTLSVRPSNAEGYEFAGEDHFSPSCLESNQGIPLADGGRLVLSPSGLAGKKEFYNALLDTPGVDPRLLKEEWVFNHYKWIIWKAAAMEVAYPLQLGGRFLMPNWVLLQLKYRYDREIDHSQRPALRKILERDDAASRRMVLCVAAIQSSDYSSGQDGKGAEQRKSLPTPSQPTLELTDGWYSIPAAIDPPLANYVRSGKIVCGTKLCIYGAELVGSQDACSPLEIPEGLKLKITANSTRRARYDARLGLQADPRPFPLPTTSLHPDGGTVGCVDVLVLRTYPMQFMEKLPEGGSVFRSAKEEAKASALHANQKQNKMEQLFNQIQRQFEAKQAGKGQGGKGKRSLASSRGKNAMDIEKLHSGEELFEAMEAALDPAAFETVLSEHQRSTLHTYQRLQTEMKQADMQAALNQALARHKKEGKFERTVVPLLKIRVADYKPSTTKGQQTTFLTIWGPTDDLVSQLVEGKRFRISSLSTSAGRNMPGMCPVQLASSRATRYKELPTASHILQRSYIPRAAASMQWLERGYTQAAYGELDVVGVVVSSEDPKQQPGSSHYHAVYLADQDGAVMAIKFWTSPAALHLDDMLKPGSFVSVTNLQYRSTPSAVPLPTALATDSTMFTPNPKAGYLQTALGQLKAGIKDVSKFVEIMQRRVQSLKDAPSQPAYLGSTPRNQPYTTRRERITTPLAGLNRAWSGTQYSPPTSVTPLGQPYQLMTVRSCPKNFLKTSQPSSVMSRDGAVNSGVQVPGSTTPHVYSGAPKGSTTAAVRTPCQSPVSSMTEVSVSPRLMAQHLEQERRSQLLSRIPSPPPLTPLPYPAASSALRRGFKIPSPLVRGSQKADPEKGLRKRLRDELEEQEETDSGQQGMDQSVVGCDDSDSTNKKQKVDPPCENEVQSHTEDHSNLEENTKGDDEVDDSDFGDDLGLSASGLRELEMSWSQSESLREPSTNDQPLKINSHEKSCPSRSKDSLDDDKGYIPANVSLEKDDQKSERLQDKKDVVPDIKETKEGTVQACTDMVNVHETKHDVIPCAEPLRAEQHNNNSGVNCGDSTNPAHGAVLQPSLGNVSDCNIDDAAETNSICKTEDSSTLNLPLHQDTIGDVAQTSSVTTAENSSLVADVPEQVHIDLKDSQDLKDTYASEDHLKSQGSVSSNPKDSTKEGSSQESIGLQQSRNDNPSQNSTHGDVSQDSSKQDQPLGSTSPKGNKRKCLSLRGRRPISDPDAVIEILEDDDSPLPKRSSRLRLQQQKNYKF